MSVLTTWRRLKVKLQQDGTSTKLSHSVYVLYFTLCICTRRYCMRVFLAVAKVRSITPINWDKVQSIFSVPKKRFECFPGYSRTVMMKPNASTFQDTPGLISLLRIFQNFQNPYAPCWRSRNGQRFALLTINVVTSLLKQSPCMMWHQLTVSHVNHSMHVWCEGTCPVLALTIWQEKWQLQIQFTYI